MQPNFNHITSHDTTRTQVIKLWAVLGWIALCLPQRLRKTKRPGKRRWTFTNYLRRVMVRLVVIAGITALSTTAQAGILYFNVGSQTSQTSGTTLDVTVPAAGVTAGNSIIICFAMGDVAGTVSASDSASNTYSVDIDKKNNTHVRTVVLAAHNVSALSSGDYIRVTTQNSVTNRAMTVAEFSGLTTTAPVLDRSKTSLGFATNMSTTVTQETTVTNDLLIGVFATKGPVSDTFTPDTSNGWALLDRDGTSSGTADITISSEYKTVTSTSAYSATATYSPKPRYAAGIVAYKGLAATVDQAHYRWRNDDGNESAASWWAAEDTKATIGIGAIQRLRFLVENEGAWSASAMAFKLEVAKTATCSSGSYSAVPTDASGDWQIVASQLVDGAATNSATTGLTDPPQFTWVDGEQEEDSATTDSITLGIDRFTEIEFSIKATGNAAEGNDYCFRLYNNTGSAPLDKYTQYAEADIGCEFQYRRLLTIDKDQVGVDNNPGTLSDVPVLVSLSGNWLKTTAVDPTNGRIEDANGRDIAFRYAGGTCTSGRPCDPLDHEIEKYDGTNGELIAWVRIPSVSKSADTDFYIYYGNECVSDDFQNASGVWDTTNGWRGVWHLHESSGNAADSTSYSSSGTLSGTVTQGSTGQIDGGYDFGSDGKVDTGDQGHHEFGTGSFSVSMWVNVDQSLSADQVLQYKGGYGTGNAGYAFVTDSTATTVDFRVRDNSDNNAASPTGSITLDTWMHLVGVVDRTANKVRLYKNGSESGTGTDISSVGTLNDSDSQVLAFSYGSANEMDGLLDEIRVYSGIQTADWIKTEFNTQNDPTQNATCTDSGFICVGSEETDPPTAITLISFSATGDINNVRVDWETGHEIRNLGFNLYRSTSAAGPFIQLNDGIIPGLEYSVKGKAYTYTDSTVTPGTLYYYKLEDIDVSGIRTFHGPVCVDWDADGMPDDWEITYGLNPWVNDADIDADKDGLTHLEEYELGFDPFNPDSDGDGTLDGQEGYRIERQDDNGSRGLMRGVQILASDDTGVTLELHTETFDTEVVIAGGQEFERLRIADYIHGRTQDVGQPEVPVKGLFLDLPEGQSATLSVLKTEVDTYSGYQVFPVPENIVDDQGTITAVGESFVWDQSAYEIDEFYPAAVARLGDGFVFRNQIKQQVLFHPLSFNPASGELRHYRKIRVRIEYEQGALAKADSHSPAPWQLPIGNEPSDSIAAASKMAIAFGASPIMVNPISPVLSSLGVLVNALWSPETGAQGTAYKILVEEEGIYRLTRDYLANNGVDVDALDLSRIRIYNLGAEIAIYVYDENADDTLDNSDYIEFYGRPVTAPYAKYGRYNLYWLVTAGGTDIPRRMLEIDGTPAAGAAAATHTYTVHHEEDEYYLGLAPGDDAFDRWFFDELVLGSALTGTPDPVSTDFSVNLPGAAGQGRLTISMWGYYDTYHEVEIQVNGVTANIANWSGISFHTVSLDGIDLLEGDNTITLTCNQDMDAVIVDWIDITYARMFAASNNSLKFSHDSGYRYQINNFDAGNLVVFDITQATDPARVVNVEISVTNPYTLEFEPPVNPGATETYLVLTSDAGKIPVELIEDTAADLALTASGADYILITHRDLGWDANGDAYGWLDDLVALREGQGLRVKVVDVQDIFDEFSYGMTSAAAIRDFLTYAYNNWEPPAPQYVLLVGDSSYDFRDNLQLGIINYVPAYLTFTQFMGETVTDEWFVKISGNDAVPDLYIGRLPAESEAEAAVMINKILTYETSPIDKTWQKNTLFIADDQNEAYEAAFEAMNEDAADLLPASMNTPFKGYLNDYLAASGLSDDIKARINAGTLIVNYSGHGALQRWAGEKIFQISAVDDLTNTGKYPFVVNMTCLTGYFGYLDPQDGPKPSMAEALVKADGKGAIAALMPTAMTSTGGQHILNAALFEAIFTKDIRQLGPAIADAKQTLLANGGEAYAEISKTFLLFGDPALALQIPIPHKPTQIEVQRTEDGIMISWQVAQDGSGNPVAGYNVYRSSTPGGIYIKINTELITETEFLDTDPGGVGASSAGGSGGGSFYYGVTSVDDSGDESAQTLGSSPADVIESTASSAAVVASCFISVTARSNSWQGLWIFVTMFISLAFIACIKARRAAPKV